MPATLRGAFESVLGSRVNAGGKGSRLREVWSRPQRSPRGGVEASHSANTPRAARYMASFYGTKLARGWSVRVGEMMRASLELDMVYGERVRAWHMY
jgi:hypothetical protein